MQTGRKLSVGDLAIIKVGEAHRLFDYNGRIVVIWNEQPNLPFITERYVIKSEFNECHNRYKTISFVNTANLEDLVPYKEGIQESMMDCMRRIERRVTAGKMLDAIRSGALKLVE